MPLEYRLTDKGSTYVTTLSDNKTTPIGSGYSYSDIEPNLCGQLRLCSCDGSSSIVTGGIIIGGIAGGAIASLPGVIPGAIIGGSIGLGIVCALESIKKKC